MIELTTEDRVRIQTALEHLQEAQYHANEAAAQLSGVRAPLDAEYQVCSHLGDQAKAAYSALSAKRARYAQRRPSAA